MLIVNKFKKIILSLAVYLVLQCTFAMSIYVTVQQEKDNLMAQVENRIAKDLSRLPLPNPDKNNAGNQGVVDNYIEGLNIQLGSHPLQPKLLSIQSNNYSILSARELLNGSFNTPYQQIYFYFSVKKLILPDFFSWLAVVISGLFYLALGQRGKIKFNKQADSITLLNDEKTRLVIDLENKVLINSKTHISAPLANKPLCFYVALIEYCVLNPGVKLNQNKDVPDELLKLADKYFYRLVELGHTIRKRPNFSSSLEKALSEIRAALDEILTDESELKEEIFPPKAYGEGSRSKLHNYGLKITTLDKVEIIGK